MPTLTPHERRQFQRVAEELAGHEHVPTCPARTKSPGRHCSDRCAVVRCVFRSLTAKVAMSEALDNRVAPV